MMEDFFLKGLVPIMKKFLNPNFLMALEFSEGFIFGRVLRRRIMQYRPYSLINSAGTTVDIAASSAQGELWLRDSRNTAKDILYMDTTTDRGLPWVLHGAIGWKPHQIMVYPRIPEGSDVPGKFPDIDPVIPSAGNRTGFYSGMESPYDVPTDFMEYIIPPKTHISHEFYNLDTEIHNPVANILFALYHFQIFTPLIATPAPTNRIIRDIALRHIPAAFFTVGFTSNPLPLGDTLREDWKVSPISLDEAATLEAE